MDNGIKKGPLFVIAGAVFFFALALVSVLTTLPSSLVDQSKNNISGFELTKKDTEVKEKRYLKELSAYKGDIQVALKEAKFEAGFAKSKTLIAESTKLVSEINILIEKNDSDDEAALTKLGNSLYIKTAEIGRNNSSILSSKTTLVSIIKNIDKTKVSVVKNLSDNKAVLDETIPRLNEGIKKHPLKKEDIEKKIKTIDGLSIENTGLSNTFSTQVENKQYVKVHKSMDPIKAFILSSSATSAKFKDMMSQLDTSYTKILSDMKTTYHCSVGRSTWDNWSDYDTTKNYIFPKVAVTQQDVAILDTATGTIASGKPRSPTAKHSSWAVMRGKITPGANLPATHDDSEFWIDSISEKFYHKYTIVRNKQNTETGWIEVDAATFDKNYNNLGMEIVSKPYGMYEEEKITVASPAGMSTVGNKQYGEWRNDSSGNSIWHYYGMYSFWGNIMGGNQYSRNDYDRYRSHRNGTGRKKPYYGNSNQYGTFGKSTYKNKRYSNSRFAKKNSSSIKRGASGRTVRGAGSRSRGRGSAGGGK